MSGWAPMTVHPPSGLSTEAEEKANEAIESYLQDAYGKHADGYAERTAQLGDKRSANDGQMKRIANEVFEGCPYAGRIAILVVGDTSDSGRYHYYERQDGETVCVEMWHGYEGAKGRDAEGRLREEHGVTGYSSWEA